MEQALGHVTYYRNLRRYTDQQTDIDPVWLPIAFEPSAGFRWVPILSGNWSLRASWRARQALCRLIASRPVDAVFFHTQVTSLFSIGIMRQVPSIVSLDATPINYDSVGLPYNHRAAGGGPLDRQKFKLNRRALRAARGHIAWSEWTKNSLIEDYGVDPRSIRVVAPGVPSSFFRVGEARLSRLDSERADRVRILFVGGDFARKGGPMLLELMRGRLAEQIELHIVTHASIPSQPGVFVYRGVEPNSQLLHELFARADLFVLPTLADCFAVALEEAAAAGLPVITTNVGALREAVDDGNSGIVIDRGDRRALEEAVRSLVLDAPRRAQMGRRGHVLARERFDAERNTRTVLDFVHAIAEAKTMLS
ncbi:MAG: glycosyltransferase family 4 protein [Chloroflexi bacterium]|nr:glycosyltransferase family 4 protein [Chloroflexota bacterium]